MHWGSILVRWGVPGIYPLIHKLIRSFLPSLNKILNVGHVPHIAWANDDIRMNNTHSLSLQGIHILLSEETGT